MGASAPTLRRPLSNALHLAGLLYVSTLRPRQRGAPRRARYRVLCDQAQTAKCHTSAVRTQAVRGSELAADTMRSCTTVQRSDGCSTSAPDVAAHWHARGRVRLAPVQAAREVTLLDYGAGNVRSVRNAITKLGYTIKDVSPLHVRARHGHRSPLQRRSRSSAGLMRTVSP